MRLAVEKTYKLYVGGKFVRSESGRVMRVPAREGAARDTVDGSMIKDTINAAKASRKDFRDAMEVARKAAAGWTARSAYNRGQILYRLAEMLEGRAADVPTTAEDLAAAVDRVVHHAGWADKISTVLSSLNPVATAHVNYSMIRALGVIVAAPAPEDGLLGMVEALCAATVMGNAINLFIPGERAALAALLAEALATCDMPGGVVNVLTTEVPSLLRWANRHDDLDGIYVASSVLTGELRTEIEVEAARVMRRVLVVDGAARPATPMQLQRLAEVKTVWMSS